MTARITVALVALLVGGLSGFMGGCADRAGDCMLNRTCGQLSAGGTSSKTAPNGGMSPIGGTSSSSTAGTGALCCTATGGTTSSDTTSDNCSITCTGEKPICNGTTGECVACTSDAHCGAATPVCDTATYTCKGCTGDVYCANPTPACDTTSQACVTCLSDAHCSGSTPACSISSVSTASNLCVECTKKDHCADKPSMPVCKTEATKCVECMVNADCSDRPTSQGTAGASGRAGAAGAGGTAGAPNSPASTPKLVCDTTVNTCVGCLGNSDCAGTPSTHVCDTGTKTCVACLGNGDCKSADASRCDLNPSSPTANTCLPCTASTDCTQVDGKHLCLTDTAETNRCVACTVTNESACNGNSCNPKTNECTSTPRGSANKCQPCLADSECGNGAGVVDPTRRCIPMTFKGAKHGEGGFCLQRSAGGCSQPFAVTLSSESLSGVALEQYCGINQEATTCEAVLDMIGSKVCEQDSNCGNAQGGLCKDFNLSPNPLRCTIPCGSADQCTDGKTCASVSDVQYCQ